MLMIWISKSYQYNASINIYSCQTFAFGWDKEK
ncbi:hypothetical protein VAA_04019 [Vibrio anguillarum 775]|nr:hypothetical protein VAA_04019 [Vibrio anguillarum 775]